MTDQKNDKYEVKQGILSVPVGEVEHIRINSLGVMSVVKEKKGRRKARKT